MLIAKTETGEYINLGFDHKKDELLSLRKKKKFICPVCEDSVLLKLGDQRVFHFAHRKGTLCRDTYERETVYHLDGKRQLFQWLIRQGIKAELEYFDSDIQQRPDIMFKYEGTKYALEFQCSPITEESFVKRTETYKQNGYLPIWIIGSKHIKEIKSNIFSLSSFHYFFLTSTKNRQYLIPSYCPEKKSFQILNSIQPYSIKNTFGSRTILPINTVGIADFLEPNPTHLIKVGQWSRESEIFSLNWSLHPSPEQNHFLHEIYRHHLNLYLLPPEIGLPICSSFFIQTPPIIWQTYLYIDVFQHYSLHDYIDLRDVEKIFNKRIRKKDIIIRRLPQMQEESPFIAVTEYILQLVKIGIVMQKSETIFQLQRCFTIPKSNREREEMRGEFYQKYERILVKI